MKTALLLFLLLPPWGDEKNPTSPPRNAPRQLPLSLRQALFLALTHNLDIEVARFQPWIDSQDLLQAVGPFDPTAYLNLSRGKRISPTSSAFLTSLGISTLEDDTLQYSAGVKQTLPLGANYNLSYQGTQVESNNTLSSGSLNPYWNQSLGISLTIPVLKNAGISSNYSSVLIERISRDSAVHSFERTLSDSLYAVEQAYWKLVLAMETQAVRVQSLEVARRLADDRRQMLERGILARVDVTQAESQVASQEEGILTAENDVQDAMDQLKRLVDPSLLEDDLLSLVPLDRPAGPGESFDEIRAAREGTENALKIRGDYRKLLNDLEAQEISLRKYQQDSFPKLDLTGSASLLGLEGNFGNTVHELGTADFRDVSAGIVLEVPLGNSLARGQRRSAELGRRRLQLSRQNLENQILVEVREAAREIKTTERRIQAASEALRLAQEQFDGEWKRRDVGVRTTFHVLDAQEDLAQARTNEIKARIDHSLALDKFRLVTGTLLAEHDIRLEECLQPRSH